MLSTRRLIATVVSMLLICATANGQMTGGTDPKDLRVTVKISEKPLGTVFRTLNKSYGIRLGFEKSSLDNDQDLNFWIDFSDSRLISVNIEDATLDVALDTICKQLKNYEWKLTDGVVNFIPKNGREKHLEALMDLKIREFKITKGTSMRDVTFNLLKLPELVAFKKENKLILQNDGRGVSSRSKRPLEFDASYTDITFRELLNKIVAETKGGWVVQRSTDDWGDDKIRYSVGM